MPQIKDNIEITQKADLFFVSEGSETMMTARDLMTVGENLTQQKAQLEFQLSGLNKRLEAFEKHKKIAQELFMKQLADKAEKKKADQEGENR